MDKTAKYLGGIGYLLMVVTPLLAFGMQQLSPLGTLGILLAAVAWIILGRELDDKVMLANGIVMIATPLTLVVLLFGLIASMLPKTNYQPPTLPPNAMAFVKILMVAMAVILILFVVGWILHLLSLFRAGSKLRISLFTYSAYCQIVFFILAFLGGALMVNGVLSIAPLLQTQMMKPNPMLLYRIFGPAFVVFAIGGVVGMIANVLTAVGFLSLEDSSTKY